MKRRTAVGVILLSSAVPALAVKKGRVKYRGGTVDIKEGKEAPYSFTDNSMIIAPKPNDGSRVSIPFEEITKIVYGQPSGTQWSSWSKSKKHFVTLSWPKNSAVFEFDKNDINRALAVLSARSEIEVEYLEEASK